MPKPRAERQHLDTSERPAPAAPIARGPAGAPGWRRSFSSLESRDYRFVWAGLLLVMGSLNMELIARGYLVYELTGSAKLLGVVSAGAAVPMLVLGLLGGAVSDRLDRRRVIQASQLAVAANSLFVAVSITTGTITWLHLLASALLHGASMSFLMPARQSIIPNMVGATRLSNAMALNAAGISVTSLFGPAAAGFLYNLVQPDAVFYITAVMSLSAVVLTSAIGSQPLEVRTAKSRLLAEMMDGLTYVAGRRVLLAVVGLMLATTLFVHTVVFLLPVIVVEVYGRTAEAYGVMISMEGLGSLAGSLVFASIVLRRSGLLLILSSLLSGVVLLVISLVTSFYVAVAIMIALGVAEAGRRVLSQATLMGQAEDGYRGRVMSLYSMAVGLMPLGVLPAGVAMDLLGGQATLSILGALMVGSSLLVLVTQRELRVLP